MLASLVRVAHVTVTVRARPGASRTQVGGSFGQPSQLVVKVNAPATDGQANAAVRQALASAFSVATADVEIITGATARSKTVRIRGDVVKLQATLNELLGVTSAEQPDLFSDS
ncbi:MAG: hypothetical protein RL745_287 [Actinomycetota bacterium]